jgi:hypothetical protein
MHQLRAAIICKCSRVKFKAEQNNITPTLLDMWCWRQELGLVALAHQPLRWNHSAQLLNPVPVMDRKAIDLDIQGTAFYSRSQAADVDTAKASWGSMANARKSNPAKLPATMPMIVPIDGEPEVEEFEGDPLSAPLPVAAVGPVRALTEVR